MSLKRKRGTLRIEARTSVFEGVQKQQSSSFDEKSRTETARPLPFPSWLLLFSSLVLYHALMFRLSPLERRRPSPAEPHDIRCTWRKDSGPVCGARSFHRKIQVARFSGSQGRNDRCKRCEGETFGPTPQAPGKHPHPAISGKMQEKCMNKS